MTLFKAQLYIKDVQRSVGILFWARNYDAAWSRLRHECPEARITSLAWTGPRGRHRSYTYQPADVKSAA